VVGGEVDAGHRLGDALLLMAALGRSWTSDPNGSSCAPIQLATTRQRRANVTGKSIGSGRFAVGLVGGGL